MKKFTQIGNLPQYQLHHQLTISKQSKTHSQTAQKQSQAPSYAQAHVFDQQALNVLMKNTKDINFQCTLTLSQEQMQIREELLKWLVANCRLKLQLRTNTIEHCIQLFDLYINKRGKFLSNLDEAQFHLLTCLFISSKFQQIYPPSIGDFQYIVKFKFHAQDIVNLQTFVLKYVKYQLDLPLLSDWFYGLTGKSMPEWVLLALPYLPMGVSLQKMSICLAEVSSTNYLNNIYSNSNENVQGLNFISNKLSQKQQDKAVSGLLSKFKKIG